MPRREALLYGVLARTPKSVIIGWGVRTPEVRGDQSAAELFLRRLEGPDEPGGIAAVPVVATQLRSRSSASADGVPGR